MQAISWDLEGNDSVQENDKKERKDDCYALNHKWTNSDAAEILDVVLNLKFGYVNLDKESLKFLFW